MGLSEGQQGPEQPVCFPLGLEVGFKIHIFQGGQIPRKDPAKPLNKAIVFP